MFCLACLGRARKTRERQATKDPQINLFRLKIAQRRDYCSMLVELDDAVGEIVDLYKQHGLWDDTLLIVTTDNGGMVNCTRDIFAHH